jgi:hypothetical protein
MNLFKRIERDLAALALAPFVGLEKKERDRKLQERLNRIEQKH